MPNYSGIWNISSQANAKAAGTWPNAPTATLYGWGYNNYGQLGLGNTTSYSSPKQIGAIEALSIAVTSYRTGVISVGKLLTFGAGSYGVLGLGNTTSYSSPN